MKHFRLVAISLSLLLLLAGCGNDPSPTAAAPAADQTNYSQIAITAISKLTEGNFAELSKMMDEQMRQELTEAKLKSVWDSLQMQYGKFQYYSSDFTVTSKDGVNIANIPCIFQNQTLTVILSLNKEGQISGLYFSEGNSTTSKPRLENDTDITILNGDYSLPGSLTLPEGSGPFPVVILVHGSGPSDRNEQIGPNMPFMDIAQQLSAAGIATVRYDKRTYVYGKELAEQGDLTVYEETIDDVAAAVAFVKTLNTIDSNQIYIAGHSLGGYLMPRIAQAAPEARGFMVLAGAARPIPDLYLEQTQYILSIDKTTAEETKENLLQQTAEVINRIKTLTFDTQYTAEDLLGTPPSYWLDLAQYDPVVEAQRITKPILFIQGGRDYQVTNTDYKLWQDGLKQHANAEFQYFDNLNHLFMSGTGKSTPAEYQAKGTVNEEIPAAMADFIQRHSAVQ